MCGCWSWSGSEVGWGAEEEEEEEEEAVARAVMRWRWRWRWGGQEAWLKNDEASMRAVFLPLEEKENEETRRLTIMVVEQRAGQGGEMKIILQQN